MMISFQETQNQEESYSLAKDREKRDQKSLKRYGFEDVVSFALVANSRDPSSHQLGMPKEVELPQKNKT